MAKSKKPIGAKELQKARRAEAVLVAQRAKKKSRQNLIIVICITAVVITAVVLLSIFTSDRQGRTDILEEYSDGVQSVRFFENGSFAANLSHGAFKSGTYTMSDANGIITVTFITNTGRDTATISGGSLFLPAEWQDFCGHNPVLPKI